MGAYFGFRAIAKWNESNTLCPQTQCGASAVSLAQDARQSATIADVPVAVAFAFLGDRQPLVASWCAQSGGPEYFAVDVARLRALGARRDMRETD